MLHDISYYFVTTIPATAITISLLVQQSRKGECFFLTVPIEVLGLVLIGVGWVVWPSQNQTPWAMAGSVTIRFCDKVLVIVLEAGVGSAPLKPHELRMVGNGGAAGSGVGQAQPSPGGRNGVISHPASPTPPRRYPRLQ